MCLLQGLRLAFCFLQTIQLTGARDHLRVLLAALSRAAGGNPIVKALSCSGCIRLRSAQLEFGLIQRILRIALGALSGFDALAQWIGLRLIDEIIRLNLRLDLWQITYDRATQSNQKARKYESHEPQATTKPFF